MCLGLDNYYLCLFSVFIGADDTERRRRYCDHFVTMYVCVGMLDNKTKTPDWNGLKLGTLVVLGTVSKPTDMGFKRSRIRVSVRGRRRFVSPQSARSFLPRDAMRKRGGHAVFAVARCPSVRPSVCLSLLLLLLLLQMY